MNSGLRHIPLLIGKVFLPDFTEEGSHGTPTERLDMMTEYEPGDDVAACLMGAKLAGWSVGYEFMPVHDLKKGDKPRDVICARKAESHLFVLLRVSTRTADFGHAAMISVFGDAALYQRDRMSLIASAGLIGVEKVDSNCIKDGKMDTPYWVKTVATLFARNFDSQFLAKMQNALDGETISREIAVLQGEVAPATGSNETASKSWFKRLLLIGETDGGTLASPTISMLPGTAERKPELAITAKGGGVATAYLMSTDGQLSRKWIVGGAGEVDVVLKAGRYCLYIKRLGGDDHSPPSVLYRRFKIECTKRYSFCIE